jgi:hypothetical protein
MSFDVYGGSLPWQALRSDKERNDIKSMAKPLSRQDLRNPFHYDPRLESDLVDN